MNFRIRTIFLWVSLAVLFLAACAPQEAGVPVTGETDVPAIPPVSPGDVAEAVLAAQQRLATLLNVAIEQVRLVEAEQTEWTDSCLGLGGPQESCLQVITPGWQAVFEINGQTYEVRTDQTGSIIRLAPPLGTPGAGTGLESTLWNLVSFGPAGAETPLIEGSTISLILAGGEGGGFGGCNTYGVAYQIEGQNISFESITSTKVACTKDGVTEQEQQYFQALESAGTYELQGNQLRITYDDGAGVLIYETAFPVGAAPDAGAPGG